MKNLAIRVPILLALGAGEILSPRPWRIFLLLGLLGYVVQWVNLMHMTRTVEIFRRRRHRVANQLQIISGWLQLGNGKKAEWQVDKFTDELIRQGQWFRGVSVRWGYTFLQLDSLAEQKGLMMEWINVETIIPSYQMLRMLRRAVGYAMVIGEEKIAIQFEGASFQITIYSPVQAVSGVRGMTWFQTESGEFVGFYARRTKHKGHGTAFHMTDDR